MYQHDVESMVKNGFEVKDGGDAAAAAPKSTEVQLQCCGSIYASAAISLVCRFFASSLLRILSCVGVFGTPIDRTWIGC